MGESEGTGAELRYEGIWAFNPKEEKTGVREIYRQRHGTPAPVSGHAHLPLRAL